MCKLCNIYIHIYIRIFLEITPPDIKDPSVGPEYKFRLFSVPSKFGVDVNHYVGVGLNKRHNRMVSCNNV